MFARPRTPRASGCSHSKGDVKRSSSAAHRAHGDTRKAMSLQQSTVTAQRLHRWRDEALSKQSKQLAELEERRRQEDAFFIARQSTIVSEKSAADAAERNYEVAQDMQWRKLELQTQVERDLFLREDQECTFQPHLFTPPSKYANVGVKYKEPKVIKQTEVPRKANTDPKATRQPSIDVFDRLYRHGKASKRGMQGHEDSQGERSRNHIREADLIEFLRRQEQFQRAREVGFRFGESIGSTTDTFLLSCGQERLKEAAEDTRCSFSPELSERTQELSSINRFKPIDQLLQHEYDRRQRRLEKCLGDRLSHRASPTKVRPFDRDTPSSEFKTSVFGEAAAFTGLILELQDQEARMKALEVSSCTRESPK